VAAAEATVVAEAAAVDMAAAEAAAEATAAAEAAAVDTAAGETVVAAAVTAKIINSFSIPFFKILFIKLERIFLCV
jgi:hypothetical protein